MLKALTRDRLVSEMKQG
uniref:Truncated cytochrome subunit of membrane-bound alcohol dehydrogenase n=3 Tax=Gluconobacter TaxID=441 RepID=A0A0D5ZY96_GLUTH|nr:truncated cytochrome subunit of membrane-bound alcohol dehydrogenase [Gluconobacter thailandicus]BAQ55435.1 truncated cytochrome subunit of membrane-bound alcohol dehydrogenase [Gluconobacter thailandicus NBRC 3255]BAQ55437.1 truncated cytochrome subunit of membrane-bound alcohol dehydrogenase [Gluconobacter thailandicus]BAQ55439.1 truncated cytochrome subunit of membrane-bound alcohol dehydrogenase [Gluconobacter thailandicus]BAQ55441.1 truncated cytochrome subunit of membrane-bound alcohol